ncbi:Pentatricopeptide repeat-containing protein [Apostasia shenzhenica]|uniref:Pentatricopeptide repeat-containing protein n=1 Tax=Apostasia shenzhenica TaxID=1088818 RepID=A0A2I0B851_9ASPA|nr:Pentatricopeptide repeat-containing protein [Apostasia shenzhenica]
MLCSGVLIDNTYLETKLCALYAVCGEVRGAREIFGGILLKSSFLWNMMIRGLASSGFPLESLVMYREMLWFGQKADNFSYPFVLLACGDLLLEDVGRRIHCEVVVSGYEMDVYVGNSVLSMYSKFGDMVTAQKVFDKMLTRDITSWNTIISSYVSNGQPEKALSMIGVMALSGLRFDQASFLGLLSACSCLAALRQGKEIHAFILRAGVNFSNHLSNALIDVYVKSNFIVSAQRLFERMSLRDIVSFNSMISGCSHCGNALASLHLFRRMYVEGIGPDLITFLGVLGACDQLAALQLGKNMHAHLTKRGIDHDISVSTALVDMYAKCGGLAYSCQVFSEMPTKNLISWSAMVSGYGLHGMGEEAVSTFNRMIENGMKPDRVTFTSVLSACSHAGLVDEGKKIFFQVLHEYSVTPSIEHYCCMVDLLGRAGYLDEAFNLINEMEEKPNVDVWAALVSACQIHNNVELAEIAAQNVFQLRPKGVGVFVSLSNIYAKEKRWDDVKRIRSMVRNNELKKPPGCSYVELGMTIHRFMVGDKSHPQSEGIYAKLEELKQKLKGAGYIPDTSSVYFAMEVNMKEELLWDHSERLAIAFVLLNTCAGRTVRITKNLRVCNDCHAVIKLISELFNREIVVRDAHRFHHVKNGNCSCNDYW